MARRGRPNWSVRRRTAQNRVQDVTTIQTPFGRLLDYGTVEIDAAGPSGAERFAYVRGPLRVRDELSALIDRYERGAA